MNDEKTSFHSRGGAGSLVPLCIVAASQLPPFPALFGASFQSLLRFAEALWQWAKCSARMNERGASGKSRRLCLMRDRSRRRCARFSSFFDLGSASALNLGREPITKRLGGSRPVPFLRSEGTAAVRRAGRYFSGKKNSSRPPHAPAHPGRTQPLAIDREVAVLPRGRKPSRDKGIARRGSRLRCCRTTRAAPRSVRQGSRRLFLILLAVRLDRLVGPDTRSTR